MVHYFQNKSRLANNKGGNSMRNMNGPVELDSVPSNGEGTNPLVGGFIENLNPRLAELVTAAAVSAEAPQFNSFV